MSSAPVSVPTSTPTSAFNQSGVSVAPMLTPITLSGLSNVTAASNTSSQGQNPSMQYGAPSTTNVSMQQPKVQTHTQQSHFVALSNNRSRMQQPIKEEKADSDEQAMDTSGPISNINNIMGSDTTTPLEGTSAGSQSEQRLKVEDALNYLDQVKYKFGNQPQVYNDFLDIMKEFKSQSIDTPGVIARVSTLFRGHPELIVGFNTFLPPGYKIEIQANDSISLCMIGQGGGYVVTTVQTGLPGPGGHTSSQSTIIHQHPNPQPSAATRPPPSVPSGSGRMSPQPTTASVIPSSTNSSSSFTHSFTSPFVQSAFPSLQSQPVEFNHAINYVNKIKNRFQGHPDKYKQFLEILHTYQKEQRNIKDGHPPSNKHLTEHEVYSQVAKLFENQEDLLQEFGQFLPDATNHQNTSAIDQAKKSVKMNRDYVAVQAKPLPTLAHKRPPIQPSIQERKKPKETVPAQYIKDVSLVEAGRYGTLNDFAFFDKVRVVLQSSACYQNFLRCLHLYNNELIALNELLLLVSPFLAKSPDLHNWFKEFVGVKHEAVSSFYELTHNSSSKANEKLSEEQMVEIDFSTCKRLGASYCAMPKNNMAPKCSGRSLLPLCKEVLNDVWVSFPAWSEDTAFSSSRKTSFEECIYRVEDERFELDVVIETNAAVIRSLESLAKKMARMTPEDLADFELDECLGGTSPTIHQRAIRRIYGEKAAEIIEGLKKQPYTAIPLVIRRMKAKDEEWREAQKQFNKTWREQTEKFYLKSLDLQGISFKQTDVRALRSKALINEIESLCDERQEQMNSNALPSSPHLTLLYRDRSILDDACLLLLHHVRRQTSIHKEDKRKIKQLLKHFLADLFHHTRMELSDDEDEASPDEQDGRRSPADYGTNGSRKRHANGKRGNGSSKCVQPVVVKTEKELEEDTTLLQAGKDSTEPLSAAPSTASIWSALTKQKKLSTAHESQESRRTIAKRELKLLLSDARAHELTDVDRTSLRDKANRDYLMSKDDTSEGPTSDQVPSAKRRATRRSFSQQGGESSTSQTAEPASGTVPPRIITIPNPAEDEAYTLFFANSNWYVFLRLHQILCERLSKIYEKAAILLMEEMKDENKKSSAQKLKLRDKNGLEYANYYTHFLEMIRNLLDGNLEPNAYEDSLREMFGIHAYIAYTMDKVVNNAVRQLQSIMSDETSQKCLDMFHQAGKRNGNGGFYLNMLQRASPETWYQIQAERVCGDETCVKVMIFKKHCRMTMELLECDTPSDIDVDQKAKYSSYVSKFLKSDSTISESIVAKLGVNPVFLARNVRRWKKKNLLEWTNYRQGGSLNVTTVVKEEAMDADDAPVPNPHVEYDTTGKEIKEEIKTAEAEEWDRWNTKNVDKTPSSNLRPVEEITPKMETGEEEHLILKSVENPQSERTAEFMMQENLKCQFNISSYRMVYHANSEDFIYLRGAMQKARKTHKGLAKKKRDKFARWHEKWLQNFVTKAHSTACEDFFIGKEYPTPLPLGKRISRTTVTNQENPPYRTYNKLTKRRQQRTRK